LKYAFALSSALYFIGTNLEVVGIKEDLSKLAAKESFNNAYLAHQVKDADRKNKTTVAELNAIAENLSRYEQVINSLYARVYKQIKFKVDAGYEMLATIRKIITKRMEENQHGTPTNSRILNEMM
jgi:hypothetical protein